MPIPRWTLTAAAAALVLPVAGPAFATAATDAGTTFGAAIVRALGGGDECPEDEGAQDGDVQGEFGIFEEKLDTSTEGTGECVGEGESDGDGASDIESDSDDTSEHEETDEDANEDADEGEVLDDADDGRGGTVSMISRCAPRGPDVEADWGLRNHGAFVRAAARGEELTVLGEAFDLSSQDGAEALCERLAEGVDADQADELDLEAQADESSDERHGAPDHGGHDRTGPPAHAGGGKGGNQGPPDHVREQSGGPSEPAGNGGGRPDHAREKSDGPSEKAGNGGGRPDHAGGKGGHGGGKAGNGGDRPDHAGGKGGQGAKGGKGR